MKSEWKVTCQYIGDTRKYAVYRLLDTNAVDHGGNREYAGGYIESKVAAVEIANRLNGGEEKNETNRNNQTDR